MSLLCWLIALDSLPAIAGAVGLAFLDGFQDVGKVVTGFVFGHANEVRCEEQGIIGSYDAERWRFQNTDVSCSTADQEFVQGVNLGLFHAVNSTALSKPRFSTTEVYP